MPVSADLKLVLSSVRLLTGDATTNGGRMMWPWDISQSGSINSMWPAVYQQQLVSGISFLQKNGVLCIPADNSELAYPEHCIFDLARISGVIDESTMLYWWPGTDEDTGADNNEATANKYGIGLIVAPAGVDVGNTNWTVDVQHTELATGAHAIIKPGYKFRPDARLSYGGSGNHEVLEVDTITGVVGTEVSFSTTTGCAYAYSDYDKGETFPEETDPIEATLESVDKTGMSGGASTFDESGVEVYSNIPRAEVTLTVETGALTYNATIDVAGWPDSGSLGGNISISSDKIFTNADPSYPLSMLKIPANAFNGTITAGDVAILTISPSVYNVWHRKTIKAGAQSGTRVWRTGSGGQSAV